MQVVSSAIVDKYIGESARLIREMFNYARHASLPCVSLYLVLVFTVAGQLSSLWLVHCPQGMRIDKI